MFRKYYKDANNDIKADEVFLNSVIENAHKKRVPSQKNYYRYALTAAAAVVVISAVSISFPLLTDQNDSGVISVVTQTVQPADPTVTNTPRNPIPASTAVPHPSVKTDTKALIPSKEQSVKTEKQEERKETEETQSVKTESSADAGAVKAEISQIPETADKKALFSAQIFGVTADTETADEYSEKSVSASGAAANDRVSLKNYSGDETGYGSSYKADNDEASSDSIPSLIEAPSGYYLSESTGNKYVFVSADGGEIVVEAYYTGDEDTEPVYGENSVSLTSNGTEFTVTYQNAEQSAIDEIVNLLR